VPSDGTTQEAYQYTGIVKADNVDETWPKWQHVEAAQEASPRGKVAQEASPRGKVAQEASPRGKVAQEAKQYSGIV
jgi:hypothetical protein